MRMKADKRAEGERGRRGREGGGKMEGDHPRSRPDEYNNEGKASPKILPRTLNTNEGLV